MKKLTFTIFLLSFILFNSQSQQVEAVQRTLLTKRAASWCPPCGGWGWTFFDNLILDNEGKAVFFAAHHSGNLVTDVAIELTNNFGGDYQPEFFVNHVKQSVSSSNASTVRNQIKDQVNAAFATPPAANSGFEPFYQDGKIKVDAKVKFFSTETGEFYLGMYLVEDHVISFQQNQGNNADHRKILKASFTESSWGEQLANGAISAGQEFFKSFSLSAEDPANHDYEVVGIIWKKTGSKYELVNVWSNSVIETTATREEQALTSFEIIPNFVSDEARITLDFSKIPGPISLDLLDSDGKLVNLIFDGNLPAGAHHFKLLRDDSPSGVYILRCTVGKKTMAKRVVFQ